MQLHLVLAWRDWETRPQRHKGDPCEVRLHANPNDARLCPVFWLTESLELGEEKFNRSNDKKKRATWEDSPILPPLSLTVCQKKLRVRFETAGCACHASHSLVRSGAHWAARCGLDILEVKDVGRWVNLQHLKRHVSKGKHHAENRRTENGSNPVIDFWVHDRNAHCSTVKGADKSQAIVTQHFHLTNVHQQLFLSPVQTNQWPRVAQSSFAKPLLFGKEASLLPLFHSTAHPFHSVVQLRTACSDASMTL